MEIQLVATCHISEGSINAESYKQDNETHSARVPTASW